MTAQLKAGKWFRGVFEGKVSRYCCTSAAPHDNYTLAGSKEYNQEKAVFGVCILVLILGTVITLTSRREKNPNLEGSEEEPLLGKHREILKTSDDIFTRYICNRFTIDAR